MKYLSHHRFCVGMLAVSDAVNPSLPLQYCGTKVIWYGTVSLPTNFETFLTKNKSRELVNQTQVIRSPAQALDHSPICQPPFLATFMDFTHNTYIAYLE